MYHVFVNIFLKVFVSISLFLLVWNITLLYSCTWGAHNNCTMFWLSNLRNYTILMVNHVTCLQFYLGITTGRVRAEFFHTRTWPAGQDLRPGPSPFTKQVFFPRPRPALARPRRPVKGLGPIHGPTKKKKVIQQAQH